MGIPNYLEFYSRIQSLSSSVRLEIAHPTGRILGMIDSECLYLSLLHMVQIGKLYVLLDALNIFSIFDFRYCVNIPRETEIYMLLTVI